MLHIACWNSCLSGVVRFPISPIEVLRKLKTKHDPQAAASMNPRSTTCSKPRRLPAEIFHTWSFSLILNECRSDDSELIWLLELQQQRTKQMFNLSPGTFNLSQMLRVFFPGKLNVLIGSAALLQRSVQRFAATGPYTKTFDAHVRISHKNVSLAFNGHTLIPQKISAWGSYWTRCSKVLKSWMTDSCAGFSCDKS